MRIGEFLSRTGATKDTIRHYEALRLIDSLQPDGKREYTDKDAASYEAIQEMKSYGMKLKDIQIIFMLKRTAACRDQAMLEEIHGRLALHLAGLKEEELRLRDSIEGLEAIVSDIGQAMRSMP